MKGSLKMRLALDQLQPPLRCMAFGKETMSASICDCREDLSLLQIGIYFFGFA